MKYLLDTDHLSILQRQSEPEFASILSHIKLTPEADLAVSIISFHEQILGCHTYLTRAKAPMDLVRGYQMLQDILRLYSAAQVLPFDEEAKQIYDFFLTQKIRIGTMDLRIAGIALSRNLTLVTRNILDFNRLPGLAVEDWTK